MNTHQTRYNVQHAGQNPGAVVNPLQHTNPFFNRGPIRDPDYFVGRQREVAMLFEFLRHRQSVSISGARRFGKTSLVMHVSHPAVAAPNGFPDSAWRWVYLDGAALSDLDEGHVYGAIGRELGATRADLTYAAFADLIGEYSQSACRIVLLLDEFELVAVNPRLGPSAFNRLRSLAQRYALQFVTVSKRPLAELNYAHRDTLSSPFFNIFAPLRLDALTRDDAHELLHRLSSRAGRPFTSRTIDYLIEMVGTHPLFLHVAGYHAYPLVAGGDVADPDLQLVQKRVLADVEGHLAYYWQDLDAEARFALASRSLTATPLPDDLATCGLLHNGHYLGAVVEQFIRQQTVPGLLQSGVFVLDLLRKKVSLRGRHLQLTPTEFDILKLLVERSGEVLSLEAIESSLWPGDYAVSLDRARGIIKRLRAALGDEGDRIVNLRGQGYTVDID